MLHLNGHDDGLTPLTASEARGEYFREAGFCRGDADIDFAAEQQAMDEADDADFLAQLAADADWHAANKPAAAPQKQQALESAIDKLAKEI